VVDVLDLAPRNRTAVALLPNRRSCLSSRPRAARRRSPRAQQSRLLRAGPRMPLANRLPPRAGTTPVPGA
jgi:hypothetical protein